MRRAAYLALGFAMAAAVSFGQSFTLDFNAPVPGTLTDANGLGTGFTTRLPGTGGSLQVNDSNLALGGGALSLTSTHSNISHQENPGMLEAIGVQWPTWPVSTFAVTLRLLNVNLPSSSDQVGIIVGISVTGSLRFVAHQGNGFFLVENTGGPDGGGSTSTASGLFAAGSDIDLTLTFASGAWTGSWHVITSGATGSLGPLVLPWLNPTSLFVGVTAFNAHTATSFVSTVDHFGIDDQCVVGTGLGQSNSSTARLEINGCGVGNTPGPFIVATAPLQPLTFAWQGAPLMPMILITGPMAATPFTLPGFGTIHIGTPPLFNDVLVVFDGAHMSGGLQLTTSPAGTASQTVIVPAGTPPGTQIAVQGIVEQVAGTTTYGNLLTAAFRIDVQ